MNITIKVNEIKDIGIVEECIEEYISKRYDKTRGIGWLNSVLYTYDEKTKNKLKIVVYVTKKGSIIGKTIK